MADTNFGLSGESEQLHCKKRKAVVEDDRDLNGNFKEPLSKRKNYGSLKQKGTKEKYENYKTFGLPSNKRASQTLKALVYNRVSFAKTTRQPTHAQKSSGRPIKSQK